jgi:signal transduction histidine kinase
VRREMRTETGAMPARTRKSDVSPRAPEHPSELATALARQLRNAKNDLVRRWLDRIAARVTLPSNRVFPTNDLLNHVPLLIAGIADYLEKPEREIDAEVPVSAKAMELGALRHEQGFDAYEILKEYELLAAIIFSFLTDVADEVGVEARRRDFLMCWQRIGHAIEIIRQATMTHFLRLSAERVYEREERLRRFNRTVSHELKTRVGAIRGAAQLLNEDWLDDSQRHQFQRMILQNSEGVLRVLDNLVSLSQIESDSRQRHHILLPHAAAEAARQLRSAAEAHEVHVRIQKDLPAVEVDAAAVELCLNNYLSNAIKYSDPKKSDRWVNIEAQLRFERLEGGELIVRVRDNGLGIPLESRANLFSEFFRAHENTVVGVEGSGLGLSIVKSTVEALGGRAWAEFPSDGAVFAFSLPSRRAEDAAAAGTHRPEGGAG